jgi:hypothetical protein
MVALTIVVVALLSHYREAAEVSTCVQLLVFVAHGLSTAHLHSPLQYLGFFSTIVIVVALGIITNLIVIGQER